MKAGVIIAISGVALMVLACGKPEPKAYGTANSSSNNREIADASDSSTATRLPVALTTETAHTQFRDVLEHPWVRQQQQQGLTALTDTMVQDIRSLKEGHKQLNERRKDAGLPPTTFDQESEKLVSTIQEIQQTLAPLHLAFPAGLYSILNIPTTSTAPYNTPLPFDVYKRVELGQTDLGVPFYLDMRVFDISQLQSQAAKEAAFQAVANWHIHLLKGGMKDFAAFQGKDTLVLLGHGERDRSHFDGSHGFATSDRGVFVAFFSDGRHLYVLHADAPWKNLQDKKNLFLKVVNRELTPFQEPISEYKLTAISD